MATVCEFAPDQAFMSRGRRAQDHAARGLPIRFVDMNDRVCGTGLGPCATERDGVIRYTDDNHITRSLSRALSVDLGERIAEATPREQSPATATRLSEGRLR